MSSATTTEKKTSQPEATSVPLDKGLIHWLESQASEYGLTYLLAHADDGIIWGRFEPGADVSKLKTADEAGFEDVNLPTLRLRTLQQCRLFGPQGEIFMWPGKGGGWRSRHISSDWEAPYIKAGDYIEEPQLLWGTHGNQRNGFTLLRDGSQGLKHAIPITQDIVFDADKSSKLTHPIRLVVHHYIHYEDDGVARIFLSRLVDFDLQK